MDVTALDDEEVQREDLGARAVRLPRMAVPEPDLLDTVRSISGPVDGPATGAGHPIGATRPESRQGCRAGHRRRPRRELCGTDVQCFFGNETRRYGHGAVD